MNKADTRKYIQRILKRYDVGQEVNNSDEIYLLTRLFEKHPHWEIKKGCGIKSIRVRQGSYNSKCFEILRLDGTTTDISYTQCFDGKRTDIFEIKRACRSAVADVVWKFRDDNLVPGKSICPFTGEVLFKENTHIDHYDKKFREVFDLWIKDKDIKFIKSKLNDASIDGEMNRYFTNQEVINDFISFHNNNTHLRIVSVKANLNILK